MTQQPNFTCTSSYLVLYGRYDLHLKLLCSADPQQVPCVVDSERRLTTCMLQVVSTLTLRSIKNTGIRVHLFYFILHSVSN